MVEGGRGAPGTVGRRTGKLVVGVAETAILRAISIFSGFLEELLVGIAGLTSFEAGVGAASSLGGFSLASLAAG